MSRLNLSVWLFAALLWAALLSGCSGENAPESSGIAGEQSGAAEPVVITDMTGHTVELVEPVTRAVALTAADCEIIYALGAEEILVGRGEYCDYPEAVLEIPPVQSGQELNIEQIIALEPEIVFMGTMAQSQEQASALESAGIQVINSDAMDIEGVYTAIEMIGAAVDREARAEELVASMRARFTALQTRARAADIGETAVYFEVSPLEWGLWTAGSGTFMNEISGMLEVGNIFADVEGWAEISQEQVIQRNPDYIFSVAMYLGEGALPQKEILSRSGWGGIEAVKTGKVFTLDSDEFSRPGPRLADAAEMLYSIIYGQE